MQSKMAPAFQAWEDYLKMRVDYEAEQRGYTVEWTATNADGDSTKQANDIQDLLAKGCEVVFVPCNDSQAILASVEEVHEADAIYVSYCRAVSPDATGAQVPDVTVNFASEEQAYVGVMRMFEIMEADGIVPTAMIDVHGQVIDENAINREVGLRRALVVITSYSIHYTKLYDWHHILLIGKEKRQKIKLIPALKFLVKMWKL